jgi:phosphonopyruvate decarboxylase
MIDPFNFLDILKKNNLRFATGVPDSLLKDLLKAMDLSWSEESNLIVANEGNAIAVAAGHYIGTGSPAIVYMQNSGLGNAINPITSLADPEVYSLPMLLIVGWRGEPGTKDEPQHIKQGRITEELMEVLEIPTYKIGPNSDVEDVLAEATIRMLNESRPVALLVSKDSFGSVKSEDLALPEKKLTREHAIKLIIDFLPKNALVVCTTGMASRELFEIREKNGESHKFDFLTVGSMGHASSIALGLAKNLPNRLVVCLDGDGSFLMHMGASGIIAQSNLTNFLHLLINNGAHDSVGGQPTIGFELNLQKLTKEMGYRETYTCNDEIGLLREIKRITEVSGPKFLEIKVKKGAREDLGRPTISPKENLKDFMENILD